jgi:hypothetical protein
MPKTSVFIEHIAPIERISILTRFVLKYCDTINIIDAVKLAAELANVIDELNYYHIDLNKLESNFYFYFSEHWKRRTQFLLIITKYWPEVLKELGKSDIKPEIGKSLYFKNEKYNCNVKGISNYFNINSIKNDFSYFEAEDIFQECQFILKTIHENTNDFISIVVPNTQLYEMLIIEFNIENIAYTSYVEKFDKNKQYSSEFLNQVKKYFGDFGVISQNTFDRLLKELVKHNADKKVKTNISLIKINDIKYCLDDIIILSSMNEENWKAEYNGEYWLHKSIREKIGLCHYENSRNLIEDNFYCVFNGKSKVFFTRAKKIMGMHTLESSILAKFRAKCKINNIDIKNNYIENKYLKSDKLDDTSFSEKFDLPLELSSRSIELLMKNPYGFYAKEILSISPNNIIDNKIQNIAIAFKKLINSYYIDKNKTPEILNIMKEIDFFYYQKFLNILNWLNETRPNYQESFYNILGKTKISEEFPTNIYSYADTIKNYNDYSILINYKIKSNESIKDIIEGNSSYILTTAFIAENAGFNGILPIREVQIWSLSSYGKNPIDIRTLEISNELIFNYKKRLENFLYHYFYKKDGLSVFKKQKQAYNKYKHFERS